MMSGDNKREKSNIWVAIDITLVVTVARVCPPLARLAAGADGTTIGARFMNWTMNFLFFWLMGLLWLAYREWRTSLGRVPAEA